MRDEAQSGGRIARTRREVLAGAAGATGVLAAQAIVGTKDAFAGSDGDVVLGVDNQLTSGATGVQSSDVTGLHGRCTNQLSTATGVFGEGPVGVHGTGGYVGVQGDGQSYGVSGTGNTGVYGTSSVQGGEGVRGNVQNGTGVSAISLAGTGLNAYSFSGIAIYAQGQAAGSFALNVLGRAAFDRSGLVSISYPNKSTTVSVPNGLTASSLTLATVQDASGVYVKSAVPNTSNGTVQINLNKAPGTSMKPKTAHVAWFVVN
jgi:hypothetical protein